jgi:NADP-dependent 3-hydroxy acid dehydrogenase YdfG
MEVLRMESAQEGTNNRTATIYPAAINTELLGQITDQDVAEKMTKLYEHYCDVSFSALALKIFPLLKLSLIVNRSASPVLVL